MNLTETVRAAIETWGPTKQSIACVEELGELIQVLCKKVAEKPVELEAIQEEIVDCSIMITQMQFIYFEDMTSFSALLEKKLEKLQGRIDATCPKKEVEKACPFCGSRNIWTVECSAYHVRNVRCDTCGVEGPKTCHYGNPPGFCHEEGAWALWNKRVVKTT